MSYDDSDDNSEWEVVDIVHTTTTVKTDKKHKPAKKEDVEKLAADIQAQLSLKATQGNQQILLLERKMKRQQQMSEQQLSEISSRLAQITKIQRAQEEQQKSLDRQRRDLEQQQQQQLLEQQIAIQSLSDNQMLTQKKLMEAQGQIEKTQKVAKHMTDNVHSLQAIQKQQVLQQHLTEQQWAQQAHELHSQIQQQQNLKQLQNQMNNQMANPMFPLPPPPQQQHQFQHPQQSHPQVPQQAKRGGGPPSAPGQTKDSQNSWLPSIFGFGQNINNNTAAQKQSNTSVEDMELARSRTPVLNEINLRSAEEKSNVVLEDDGMPPMPAEPEHDDDDDVLGWQNDYGTHVNPLYTQPDLLKTKGSIGEGKYMPLEKRQCGWILQNKSKTYLKLSARLECIGGGDDNGIKVQTEKLYEFELKPSEEAYVLVEVQAPSIPGKYCAFYQLVIDNGVNIGEMLEVMCEVEAQFSKAKEAKIKQIIKMGFDDRKKVVSMLQKNKWNVQRSVDLLIGAE